MIYSVFIIIVGKHLLCSIVKIPPIGPPSYNRSYIAQKVMIRFSKTGHFWKIEMKIHQYSLFSKFPDHPRGRRGSLNFTNVNTFLGLLRRPRRRSENLGNRLYRCILSYIFQKYQVCPNRMSSFWIIQLLSLTSVFSYSP